MVQSQNPDNQVFAVIRNPRTAAKLEALAQMSPNVHIVHGDLDDVSSLKVMSYRLGRAYFVKYSP